jgi:hypothetical protein
MLDTKRIEQLERRIAILEGKPDPGLPCPNTECRNGFEDTHEDRYKTRWEKCPVCLGKMKVYPSL